MTRPRSPRDLQCRSTVPDPSRDIVCLNTCQTPTHRLNSRGVVLKTPIQKRARQKSPSSPQSIATRTRIAIKGTRQRGVGGQAGRRKGVRIRVRVCIMSRLLCDSGYGRLCHNPTSAPCETLLRCPTALALFTPKPFDSIQFDSPSKNNLQIENCPEVGPHPRDGLENAGRIM